MVAARVRAAIAARATVGKPRIGITVGDPAGIGPEISVKAAADARVLEACEPIIYGPHTAPYLAPFTPGELSAEAGRTASGAIVAAVNDALAGKIDAITTAPINKEAFALAGIPFKGHTDMLAMLTQSGPAVMMFHSPELRVVLATVHVALRHVAGLLTRELMDFLIDLTAAELPRFGYLRPRIAVAGLNPHAGEHGVIGDEDESVLRPAVDRARKDRGIDASGPWPGDTVFARAARGEFDVVIACYHDQGLIPVKLLAFGRAVNVTLGLPIVRTSVDHGTAFDIAGKGIADPSSLVEAILLAAKLVGARHG
jgi:4-phospho-D-threonate 3-dehydrogenase / 4-phospho-D-erythronate 3-dehydrogenase